MKYYILLLLFIPIFTVECTYGIYNSDLPCLTSYNYRSSYQQILSNIKNNQPGLNSPTIGELFQKIFYCFYREAPNQVTQDIVKAPVYKFMFRYIFKDDEDLLLIHNAFCNNGKTTSIKNCLEKFGEDYKCSQLVDSFGSCYNDYNDRCD